MRVRRALVVVAGIAVVTGTAGYAVAAARSSGPAYRTATATRGTVTTTRALTGTVAASGVRTLGFGVAGTVHAVHVQPGQKVRAGQVLATLDSTPLQADVDQASAALADAKARLDSDENRQADTVSNAANTTPSQPAAQPTTPPTTQPTSRPQPHPTSPPTSKPTSSPNPGVPPTTLAELKQEQAGVVQAQSAANDAITAAKQALSDESEACKDDTGTPVPPSPSATDTPSTPARPSAGQVSDKCSQALADVQAAQDAVKSRQDDLQRALATLAGTLEKAVAALQHSAPQTGQSGSPQPTHPQQSPSQQPQHQPAGKQPAQQSPSAQPRAGDGQTVTAATLAQDQVGIDNAKARLTNAQAARAAAVLRAPVAGTVLDVSTASGDSVGATTDAVTVRGAGGTTVAATATNSQLAGLKPGQRAEVTPAGWATPIAGTVTQVGPLPDDSDYPVSITLDTGRAVPEGTSAAVSIVTGSASGVVTVPTSAVTKDGSRATVRVLAGGKVSTRSVTVGIVSARNTSVTSGLQPGESVVIADVHQALPSQDSGGNGRNRFGGGPGGLGGGKGGPLVRFQGPPPGGGG